MMEYIERGKAIKAVEQLQDCYNGFSDTYDKACIIGVLEEVPTANVAPVIRGKWMKNGYKWMCSRCEENYSVYDEAFLMHCSHYCPNCGARMD